MMGGLGMGFGWIFWIFLAVAGFWLFKYLMDQNKNGSSKTIDKTPIDILKELYAKGEINKEEFAERRKELINL
ncbi:MAG TPA: SHOCT domain-containing protein [Bacteroidetes bacterium]|nr:SHOCT domain-containing protein [Bacteroidota bacterium]